MTAGIAKEAGRKYFEDGCIASTSDQLIRVLFLTFDGVEGKWNPRNLTDATD